MALQVIIGAERGSDENVALPITVYDDAGADVSLTAAVAKAIENEQAVYFGNTTPQSYGLNQLAPDAWEITVNYGAVDLTPFPRPSPPAGGSIRYLFSYRAQAEFFKVAKNTRRSTGALDFKTGINVDLDANDVPRSQGMTAPPPTVTDRLEYQFSNGFITASYRNAVRQLLGKVNSNNFLDQPPGTMRFVEVNASVTSDDQVSIDFGFAYRPIQTVTISPGKSVTPETGHDIIWTFDPTGFFIQPGGEEVAAATPKDVYASRVFDFANFANFAFPTIPG